MSDQNTISPSRWAPLSLISVWRDRLILQMTQLCTRSVSRGRLRLTLPSGASGVIGHGGATEAHLVLTNFRVFNKAIRRGSIGFADAYMSGDVESPNLGDVLRFFIDNKSGLRASGRGYFKVRRSDTRFHADRANTREGSKRNIAAHYDLGNAFYAAWLDRSMTYSSARFTAQDQTLEAAQDEKNRRLIEGLDLKPGHTVLEIGCGWGGFAQAAATVGAHVTGLTISAEQLAYAEARIKAAGLSQRVDFRFQDYRDVTGTFDHVASVEMIEAVGEDHWPSYFKTIAACLKPGGTAMIQAITIHPDSYESYRAKADFIQRYIFPGGMLPTEALMAEHARAHGLTLETVETFGTDYVRTLKMWRHSFEQAWPRIATLGFDDRFRRMWLYYLIYCEVGFERGMTNVGHYRLTKPA